MSSPRKNNGKRSKPFPWKTVFGAIAILGVMVLLSSPNDPGAIKGGSSAKTAQDGLSGFSFGK